jgi:Ca2+-dependent lipid-binding protein
MIYLHVYEIDSDLNILDDFNNKVSFQTFKEKKFQASLSSTDSSTTLDADLNLQWMESGSGDSTAEKLKTVKSFTVSIKSASGLLPPSSGNKLDTFCEVYFGKDKVGRTNVVKDSATPVWNETFTIPFKGKGQPLIIDVFEMTMLGKGPFRGRIEISVEQKSNVDQLKS